MMNHGSRTSRHGRLRDRLRDETGLAILAAAEEVFAEQGLHAARMEHIASRAGVAVGTLYNHFEDRDALLQSLVRARRGALLDRVDAAVATLHRHPVREQLRAFLLAVEEHARAHGRFMAVLVQSGEGPGRLRPPRTLVAELVARADAIVARGVSAGELREDEAKVFGAAIVGTARAVLVRAVDGSGEGVVDAVLELFMRGAGK